MVVQNSFKVCSLVSSKLSHSAKQQKGIYLAAARAMSTGEVGSGAGKGGGSGGRLVEEGEKKAKSLLNEFIKRVESLLKGDGSDSSCVNNQSKHDTVKSCGKVTYTNNLSPQNSIREAGGVMGRKGAAQEEAYFAKQNNAVKEKLKHHLEDEIKRHEEAIKANKEAMKELEKNK